MLVWAINRAIRLVPGMFATKYIKFLLVESDVDTQFISTPTLTITPDLLIAPVTTFAFVASHTIKLGTPSSFRRLAPPQLNAPGARDVVATLAPVISNRYTIPPPPLLTDW